MTRAALLKRLDLLEARLAPPPSLAAEILRRATNAELERLEMEIAQHGCASWEALVASYLAGERGS